MKIRSILNSERKAVNVYYLFIVLSVVMFGGCFALNDIYRQKRGSNLKISLQYSLIGSFASLLFLIVVNGFKFEFTFFTLIMAIITAANSFVFTFCSFKALDRINISLYSLFTMLGGMALPFLQGILFYGEKLTVAKSVCFLFIVIALLLVVEREKKGNGTIYYICIFVLNGMSGVISKFFAESTFPKTSATGYTIWVSVCSVVISALLLLIFFNEKPQDGENIFSGMWVGMASGITNKVANLLLVIALARVDASVQYPMVTGGVMIASTLICFFGENKPSKKEILSILVAFIGLLLMFVISI